MRRQLIASACLVLATTLGVSGTTTQAVAAHRSPAAQYVPPVPLKKMLPKLRTYRRYVHARITELVPEVAELTHQLGSHDTAAAKRTWLTARTTWLRIGQDNSAYGVFGDLGQHIDGTAAGHSRGVHDPAFTGFHRVEYDLWRRHNVAAAHADAVRLESYVHQLAHVSLNHAISSDANGATSFVLRSHEIIEDAVRDTLSGDDEYGSGTGLASVAADVSATREVLKLLAPMIKARSHGLVGKAGRELTRVMAVADAGRHNGHWIALSALRRHQREEINAAVGAADETLATVPELLEG